jgi:hypothetical protein
LENYNKWNRDCILNGSFENKFGLNWSRTGNSIAGFKIKVKCSGENLFYNILIIGNEGTQV